MNEEWLGRQKIAEAYARYCRAWDRADVALALTVWSPDGTAQYPGEAVRSVSEMIPERLNARRALGMVTSHQVTNMLVEFSGDQAASEAYGTAWTQQRRADGAVVQQHYFCRYLDRWSRRSGRWAIGHRHVILDGFSEQVVTQDGAMLGALGPSTMDASDPSYAHFSALP